MLEYLGVAADTLDTGAIERLRVERVASEYMIILGVGWDENKGRLLVEYIGKKGGLELGRRWLWRVLEGLQGVELAGFEDSQNWRVRRA